MNPDRVKEGTSQASAPGHTTMSSQGAPAGSGVHDIVKPSPPEDSSLHTSQASQGSPVLSQVPAPSQVSVPVQTRPSSQDVPTASKGQVSESSSQVLAHSSVHGLPALVQAPAPSQVPPPLQNRPSLLQLVPAGTPLRYCLLRGPKPPCVATGRGRLEVSSYAHQKFGAAGYGAPGRTRTSDAWFRKPTLYPLSYGGAGAECIEGRGRPVSVLDDRVHVFHPEGGAALEAR